jgi:periplasmic divalent cation tolerance protein
MIYVTYPNKGEAEKIVHSLIKKKLIACANFFPVKSSFWWKGKVNNSEEIVSILKTQKKNWNKIKTEISEMHPYETPCIIKLNAEANEEFDNWVKKETK